MIMYMYNMVKPGKGASYPTYRCREWSGECFFVCLWFLYVFRERRKWLWKHLQVPFAAQTVPPSSFRPTPASFYSFLIFLDLPGPLPIFPHFPASTNAFKTTPGAYVWVQQCTWHFCLWFLFLLIHPSNEGETLNIFKVKACTLRNKGLEITF